MLGGGSLLPRWEGVLDGRCAGEQVEMVVENKLLYVMDIVVITRLLRSHLPGIRHFGILRCQEIN